MSTWYTESFNGQILWDLARCRALTKEEWTDYAIKCNLYFPGGTLQATGDFSEVKYPTGYTADILALKEGNTKLDKQTFYDIFFDYPRTREVHHEFGHALKKVRTKVKTALCGLEAVYKLYVRFASDSVKVKEDVLKKEFTWVKSYINHTLKCQSYSMYTQPQVIDKVIARIPYNAVHQAMRWKHLAKIARNLITMRWHGAAKKCAFGIKDLVNFATYANLGFSEDDEIYFDGWITVLRFADQEEGEYYLLTSVDLDRLQQMCVSKAMYELSTATFALTSGNDAKRYANYKKKMDAILIEALKRCNYISAQGICRDMKKAFGIYLSKLAGKLSDEGTASLYREAKDKGYDKSFEFYKYLKLLGSMPIDIAQDIGRIYKLLPAPDYDIGASFVTRQKQHLAPNPILSRNIPFPVNLEEFRKYLRKFMIVTLTRRNGGKGVGRHRTNPDTEWYKAYMEKGDLPSGTDWVDEIDLTGVVEYKRRHNDSVLAWKDTAACEEELDEVLEDKEFNAKKRNMLLRYLFDPQCPTHEEARRKSYHQPQVHRAGFKMEAAKTWDSCRNFYIGNLRMRIWQSEVEENIHRVAQYALGYNIGLTTDKSIEKIMGMVAPDLDVDEKVYYLNFDISGWSPNMNKLLQRVSNEIWAEVFNEPSLKNLHHINENSIVVLNKLGYKGVYVNPGANFEGYNGKQSTFLHAAIMGYAVMVHNMRTGKKVKVKLSAFIDDGLATMVDKKDNGPDNFLQLYNTMELVYETLGLKLEKNKCYLSDRFAIFLNEIYYEGRHITYGLRALMRIGTSMPEKHETLPALINKYVSGAQGAMKAGLDGISAYFTYLFSMATLLLDQGIAKHMDFKAAVLFTFCPKALGGLGQTGYMGIATNYVTDALSEGISLLQLMCKIYPPYKPAVVKLLRQKVVVKSDVAIFNSPRTIKPLEGSIVESRINRAIAKRLAKLDLAPQAKRIMSLVKGNDDALAAECIVNANVVLVEPLLVQIKECMPSSLLEALVKKFESSKTIQALLGRAEMNKICTLNRTDVLRAFIAFKNRFN